MECDVFKQNQKLEEENRSLRREVAGLNTAIASLKYTLRATKDKEPIAVLSNGSHVLSIYDEMSTKRRVSQLRATIQEFMCNGTA